MVGYNGFGRLTGDEPGSVGGMGQAGSRWGPVGWTRMFNSEFGAQASWLIPCALVLLVAGLIWLGVRATRTDRTRAALLLWGGWLVLTAIVFSLGQGIIHAYYTVALGPAIGGVFIAGFLAPRASWLLGAIVGFVAAICYSVLVIAFPTTLFAAATPTPIDSATAGTISQRAPPRNESTARATPIRTMTAATGTPKPRPVTKAPAAASTPKPQKTAMAMAITPRTRATSRPRPPSTGRPVPSSEGTNRATAR